MQTLHTRQWCARGGLKASQVLQKRGGVDMMLDVDGDEEASGGGAPVSRVESRVVGVHEWGTRPGEVVIAW